MAETQKTRDSRGRFLPRGGNKGGVEGQLVDSLRRRLGKLLDEPTSKPREIGQVMRALEGAHRLRLVEKQIALADQKLAGKGDGLDLAEIAKAMATADAEYDKEYQAAAGKVP